MTDREALTHLGNQLALAERNRECRANPTRLPAAFASGYEPLAGVVHCKDFEQQPKAPAPMPVTGLDKHRLALMGLGPEVCVWAGEASEAELS